MIVYYKIKETANSKYQLKGKGLRKCLFILNEQDHEEGEVKLEEILKAIHLDKQKDILIWLTDEINHDLVQEIITEYGIETVTSFGMDVSALYSNINVKDYFILKMENLSWLPVPPLKEILASRNEKMKLWKSLQKLYLK